MRITKKMFLFISVLVSAIGFGIFSYREKIFEYYRIKGRLRSNTDEMGDRFDPGPHREDVISTILRKEALDTLHQEKTILTETYNSAKENYPE
ncbi:MAG: hypothetical protein KAJ79_06775 [Candidatus Omnitrophica bacterium]|nr:hypothetical protein [Candidatus Omnitrophota bacterium]